MNHLTSQNKLFVKMVNSFSSILTVGNLWTPRSNTLKRFGRDPEGLRKARKQKGYHFSLLKSYFFLWWILLLHFLRAGRRQHAIRGLPLDTWPRLFHYKRFAVLKFIICKSPLCAVSTSVIALFKDCASSRPRKTKAF